MSYEKRISNRLSVFQQFLFNIVVTKIFKILISLLIQYYNYNINYLQFPKLETRLNINLKQF